MSCKEKRRNRIFVAIGMEGKIGEEKERTGK
jgi:hypothetical protein